MLILAIDTSGDTCSVAASDNAAVRAEYSFRHERHLSERISAIVAFLLRDAGLALSDIEAFAAGLGPGSFTGVRVGVTMAKVWAMTLEKPVVGISSLDALAEPLRFTGLPLACVAPTRRTESVAAFYEPGSAAPTSPPAVVADAEIVALARARFGTGAVLVAGEIAARIVAATGEVDRAGVVVADRGVGAAAVARLAWTRLERGEWDDTDLLVPLYVTPPPTG